MVSDSLEHYTWDPLPTVEIPFGGDFSGDAWNSQAMLAAHAGKQHEKMRHSYGLAAKHDFLMLEDTHSNKGKIITATTPSD